MSQLPEMRCSPAPRWQRERLGRWLREWEIECRLVEPEGPEDDMTGDAYVIETAPGVVEEAEVHLPAVGQIRLLRPAKGPSAMHPLYVAILAQNDDGRFLVAPYGRFSEPAIPGELKTGRDEPCLRVLCLWKAQRVTTEQLARTWLVGELAEGERSEASAIHAFIDEGTPIPEALIERIGPPLVHPADPRHEYLDEENSLVIIHDTNSVPAPRPHLARAAEERAKYGARRR